MSCISDKKREKQAQKLIDLAIVSVTKRVRSPRGRLENLKSYQNQAVYLGQLNLALGVYYLISDDNRYDKLHQVLSDAFHKTLVESQGGNRYGTGCDTIAVEDKQRLGRLAKQMRASSVLIRPLLVKSQQF